MTNLNNIKETTRQLINSSDLRSICVIAINAEGQISFASSVEAVDNFQIIGGLEFIKSTISAPMVGQLQLQQIKQSRM